MKEQRVTKICTKKGNIKVKTIKTSKETKLANAQYGRWTKPPNMIIERKSSELRLQPHKSKRFNLLHDLRCRAFFIIK
jgi:hypothetical protein